MQQAPQMQQSGQYCVCFILINDPKHKHKLDGELNNMLDSYFIGLDVKHAEKLRWEAKEFTCSQNLQVVRGWLNHIEEHHQVLWIIVKPLCLPNSFW